jgi:hypothetical protein
MSYPLGKRRISPDLYARRMTLLADYLSSFRLIKGSGLASDERSFYRRDGLSAPAFRHGDESPVVRKGHALRLTNTRPPGTLVL